MVTTFSPAEIDRVREAVDLVEVVRQHVTLKRAGQRYKGLCPFHDERTPSFTVDPVQNLFYCFGCGAGGNVFQFVERVEGLSFPEAVTRVARIAGIEPVVERTDAKRARAARSRRERLLDLHNEAARRFAVCIREGPGAPAREYLKGRGVTGEVARTFGLGFALPAWDALSSELIARGFSESEIVESGLAAPRKSGNGVYDRFRGRIMFPVRGLDGRVVAFGGRALADEDGPKYVNSPETPIYHKGRVLYGLYEAREALRKRREAILVEGYMDVLALHQAGVREAVATCGTALTVDHAKLLRRLVARVVLAYDADAAGESASLRGLDILAGAGLEVRVLSLPDGDDPDELVRRRGGDAFRRVLAGALPFREYQLRTAIKGIDIRSTEGKLRAAAKVVPILARIDGAVERAEYTAWAARLLQVSADDLEHDVRAYEENAGREGSSRHRIGQVAYTNKDFDRARPPRRGGAGKRAGRDGAQPIPTSERMERALLAMLVADPSKLAEVVPVLTPGDFASASLTALFERLRAAWAEGRLESADDVAGLADRDARKLAEQLGKEEAADGRVNFSLDVLLAGVKEASLLRRLLHVEGELIKVDLDTKRAAGPEHGFSLERLGTLLVVFGELRREYETWIGMKSESTRRTDSGVS